MYSSCLHNPGNDNYIRICFGETSPTYSAERDCARKLGGGGDFRPQFTYASRSLLANLALQLCPRMTQFQISGATLAADS